MKGHAWEGRWRPAGWLKQESTVRRSKGEAKSTPPGREQGLLSPDSPLLLHSNSCVFVLVVMGTELRASYSVHYGRNPRPEQEKFSLMLLVNWEFGLSYPVRLCLGIK